VGTLGRRRRALASAVPAPRASAARPATSASGHPAPRGRPRRRAGRGPGGDDLGKRAARQITEARAEAGRAGDLLRLSAFRGTQLYGDSLPLDASAGAGLHRLGFTLRQPCGVVVAITPFNYPLLLACTRSRPRFAAGNAVVLKPARQTPLTALQLVEILLEAGSRRRPSPASPARAASSGTRS
jgi:hypothetical protein